MDSPSLAPLHLSLSLRLFSLVIYTSLFTVQVETKKLTRKHTTIKIEKNTKILI